jgi:hypothetical protein
MGGIAALAASRALDRQLQHLAYNFYLGFADRNPWVMNRLYAVALDLQCWNQRQSIRQYLAWQTWRRLMATTIQCWKQGIWLEGWFDQQAKECQAPPPAFLVPWCFGIRHVGTGTLLSTSYPN